MDHQGAIDSMSTSFQIFVSWDRGGYLMWTYCSEILPKGLRKNKAINLREENADERRFIVRMYE